MSAMVAVPVLTGLTRWFEIKHVVMGLMATRAVVCAAFPFLVQDARTAWSGGWRNIERQAFGLRVYSCVCIACAYTLTNATLFV